MEKKNTPIEIMDAIDQLDERIHKAKNSLEQNVNSMTDANWTLINLDKKYTRNESIDYSEIETIGKKADDIEAMSEEINVKIKKFLDYFQKASEK